MEFEGRLDVSAVGVMMIVAAVAVTGGCPASEAKGPLVDVALPRGVVVVVALVGAVGFMSPRNPSRVVDLVADEGGCHVLSGEVAVGESQRGGAPVVGVVALKRVVVVDGRGAAVDGVARGGALARR